MRILTTLPQDDLAEVPAAARAAEAAGYDGLVTSENRNGSRTISPGCSGSGEGMMSRSARKRGRGAAIRTVLADERASGQYRLPPPDHVLGWLDRVRPG